MTDDHAPNELPSEEFGDNGGDSDPITGLLRSALEKPPTPSKSLLPGIQQRIRVRTRGRYYRDRSGPSRDPVPLLLMAALLILVLAAALFLALQPLVDAPADPNLKQTVEPSHRVE